MCYDDQARPPMPPDAGGPADGQDIVLTAADGNHFAAYVAVPRDASTMAQVIIFPDVRGLHQFYKDLAIRFAEQGIAALAIDYFGRTAGLTARDDSFEFMPHVQQMHFNSFLADVRAALEYLPSADQASRRVFTLGFCMGGTLSFLTATQDLGQSGAVGFYAGMSRNFGGYGTLPERAPSIRVPVLGLFGGADQGIPVEQVEAFDRTLDGTGVDHKVIIYPGAPHSFFDRRSTEFAEASADAWRQGLTFIAAHT